MGCLDMGCVSVPLRGLIMWKLRFSNDAYNSILVSVPLRGLIMWKQTK